MSTFVGIDISKKTFDIYFEHEGKTCHVNLQQTEPDYKVLLHLIGPDAICVMEATGNYHIHLAHYLYQAGLRVVVENPLKIKRFSQMQLQRTKTDKADSRLIYAYGSTILSHTKPRYWQPDNEEIGQLKQYDTVRNQLLKQRTALSNTEEAMAGLTGLNKEVTAVLTGIVTAVENAIKQLDKGMLKLVKGIMKIALTW